MSHFIAHTISFSKDFKTFKVKGGDNNVIPRSNYWSNDIPIDSLYYNLNGGMIKLSGTSEKNAFIRFLVNDIDFGGDWTTETDYYHMKNKSDRGDDIPEVIEFNHRFKTRLVDGIKTLSAKKDFVLRVNGNYAYKANPTHLKMTHNKDNAQRLSYYRGMEILSQYKHLNAELI